MPYYPRLLEANLQKYLNLFPVVGITGPRQSGKSTLLKHQLAQKYRYVSFDHQPTIDTFYHDPESFMALYDDRTIFDEVQKAPEIFNYIKIAVDNDRQNYGKYVLTGSSQFSFKHKITESLAGRMGLLTLLPFSYTEIPKNLRDLAIFSGSYPELVNRKYAYKEEWYASYLTTYLEKDLRSLSHIGDLHDFSRFINLLAANAAQLLNLSTYACDIGVSVSTIKRWLSVLEASYIIFLLPPYFKNYGKRLIKSPKIYFFDTGLVAYLTRISTQELYEHGPMAGALFENYVIAEIYKRESLSPANKQLCYFRTNHGEEVDLIIDRFHTKEVIEIKSSHTFKPNMIKPLKTLLTQKDQGYLLYKGQPFLGDTQVKIMNYRDYLTETGK